MEIKRKRKNPKDLTIQVLFVKTLLLDWNQTHKAKLQVRCLKEAVLISLPPYCVLGDAGNVESCISHASYMFSREEPVCITQNAVQNFIQQTPFLSGNTSEILSFFLKNILPRFTP